jgi:C-terminal processing protease CtpA/Prc
MFVRFVISFIASVFFCSAVSGQATAFEKDRHKEILRLVKDDVKKHYFDPSFKGIDIEAKYQIAVEKISKAQSIGQLTGIIGQFLIEFDDSHLYFLPPGKANKTDYGFSYRMIGQKCLVVGVDKKSEAEKVGLQVGDELLSIEGYGPTRENIWKLEYLLSILRPQPGLNVVVLKPNGTEIKYPIAAQIKKGKRILDLTGQDLNNVLRESDDEYRKSVKQYFYDKFDGVFIWKMPSFSLEPMKVDDIIDRAKKSPAIVFDLRGNGGGRVDMLMRLVANVFDKEVKVGDEKKRKETKELISKTRGNDAYQGKVIVLIDSGSASASEVFSRVVQLEKRGQVFGDRSAGAVMESRMVGRQLGMDTVIYFGTSVTVADLIMKDGKSLEKVGVVPDVVVIPTPLDVAERNDIVLSQALESIGVKVTPKVAGSIFPDVEDVR